MNIKTNIIAATVAVFTISYAACVTAGERWLPSETVRINQTEASDCLRSPGGSFRGMACQYDGNKPVTAALQVQNAKTGQPLSSGCVVKAVTPERAADKVAHLPPQPVKQIEVKVDWPAFLARQDLVYMVMPTTYLSGAFMGNGQLGAMVYSLDKGKSLNWHIGRSDVYFNVARAEFSGRIPIGDFSLQTTGAVKGAAMRLELWNAELTGTLKTAKGQITLRSYTHAEQMVQVMELTPSDGEQGCRFDWKPGLAVSPRLLIKKKPVPADEKNPAPVTRTEGGITLCTQAYCTGGGHATAWVEVAQGDTRTLLVSVGYSQKEIGAAEQEALAAVRKAQATGLEALRGSHRAWWHKFWPASFVSFPDAKLEKFYWMQMYKMASVSLADLPALDLMGPWFYRSPWTKIWWNLNLQLTYWPQLGSNRLELGESLCRLLDNGAANLAKNAGEFAADSAAIGGNSGYDCASPFAAMHGWPDLSTLAWTVHNYYLQYRYSMDDAMLRDRIFPLLKRCMNFYFHHMKKGADGKLHTTTGFSPEYEHQPNPNPDCNIDLALIRWGCQTLLDTCARLKINDPQIPQWRDTLANLTPYPVDQNGLMISASVPFSHSHRHFSHLLMIYPLYIMNTDQPENRALVITSLRHWMGLDKALAGFSYTGAASISASLGDGDAACKYLHKLTSWNRIGSNTLYMEAGPCIETPLAAAASVHDMLLSSWGDRIRVFPAVPTAWKDVTIHNMRTEGAFLVSAVRKDGKTRFVRVTSLAGEPCRLRTDMGEILTDRPLPVKDLGGGTVELGLKKGESITLWPKGTQPDFAIESTGQPRLNGVMKPREAR